MGYWGAGDYGLSLRRRGISVKLRLTHCASRRFTGSQREILRDFGKEEWFVLQGEVSLTGRGEKKEKLSAFN